MGHGYEKSKMSCRHESWLQAIQNLLSPWAMATSIDLRRILCRRDSWRRRTLLRSVPRADKILPFYSDFYLELLEVKSHKKKTINKKSLVAMGHGYEKSKMSCRHESWLQAIQNLLSPWAMATSIDLRRILCRRDSWRRRTLLRSVPRADKILPFYSDFYLEL